MLPVIVVGEFLILTAGNVGLSVWLDRRKS